MSVTTPATRVFNEIRDGAIEIWKTYDDTYGYATEKIDRIKDLNNITDNALYIISMFDLFNQRKLYEKLSQEALDYLREYVMGL